MVLAALRSRAVSPTLVLLALLSFTAGLVGGGVAYAQSSGTVDPQVPGTHAWSVHAVLLLAAVAALAWVRSRRGNWSWLYAPIGRTAARRCRATVRSTFRGPLALARTAGSLLLIALVLACCARLGYQVLGALDANETVNAWGGPTYLGALLGHGLDLALIVAACAALLAKLLAPAPDQAPTERLPIVPPNPRPHDDPSLRRPRSRSGGPDHRRHHHDTAVDGGAT